MAFTYVYYLECSHKETVPANRPDLANGWHIVENAAEQINNYGFKSPYGGFKDDAYSYLSHVIYINDLNYPVQVKMQLFGYEDIITVAPGSTGQFNIGILQTSNWNSAGYYTRFVVSRIEIPETYKNYGSYGDTPSEPLFTGGSGVTIDRTDTGITVDFGNGTKYDPTEKTFVTDRYDWQDDDTEIIKELPNFVIDNFGNIRHKKDGKILVSGEKLKNLGIEPGEITNVIVNDDGSVTISNGVNGEQVTIDKESISCNDHWILYTDKLHIVFAGRGVSGEAISAEGDYRLGQFTSMPFNLITGQPANDTSILFNGSVSEITGFSVYSDNDTSVGDVDFDIECLTFDIDLSDDPPQSILDAITLFKYKRVAHVSFKKGQKYGRVVYDDKFQLGYNSWTKLTSMCRVEFIRINNLSYSAPFEPYCGKTDENNYSGGGIDSDSLSPVSNIADELSDIKDILKELVEAVQNIQPIIEITDDMQLDYSTRRKKGFNTSYDVYEY